MSLPNASTALPTFDPAIVAAGHSIEIDDAPALPRIEARPPVLEAQDFDLDRELERVVDLMATRADAKGIELASFVDHEVPTRLQGAVARFHQVAAHLVGHAVQATERGGVLVRVSLARETSRDAVVQVSIWYTGQPDGTAGDRPGHAFPALRRLVELMGGEIGCDTGAGGGSVLWFTACFTKSHSDYAPESPRASASPRESSALPSGPECAGNPRRPVSSDAGQRSRASRPGSRRARVLVAESDVVNQRITLLQLSRLGYLADGVATQAEALEALSQTRYDVVLMDGGTLDLNGPAIALIRSDDRADRRTAIVAMTANESEDERDRLATAGMDECLGKPVKTEELQLVLSRLDIDPVCACEAQTLEAQPAGDQVPERQTIGPRTAAVYAQRRPSSGRTTVRWSRADRAIAPRA
jgi:two-component system, sensor histidine kinase